MQRSDDHVPGCKLPTQHSCQLANFDAMRPAPCSQVGFCIPYQWEDSMLTFEVGTCNAIFNASKVYAIFIECFICQHSKSMPSLSIRSSLCAHQLSQIWIRRWKSQPIETYGDAASHNTLQLSKKPTLKIKHSKEANFHCK